MTYVTHLKLAHRRRVPSWLIPALLGILAASGWGAYLYQRHVDATLRIERDLSWRLADMCANWRNYQ